MQHGNLHLLTRWKVICQSHLMSNFQIGYKCEIWPHLKGWSPIGTIIMFWGVWYLIIWDSTHDKDKLDDLRPMFIDLAMSFKVLGLMRLA